MSVEAKSPRRRTQRRRRSPLTVRQVQAAMSEAIEIVEHYIVEPYRKGEAVDTQELARLAHALTQAAVAYRGLLDAAAFADELQAVRDQVAELAKEAAKAQDAAQVKGRNGDA